jgi:hypothetical protein
MIAPAARVRVGVNCPRRGSIKVPTSTFTVGLLSPPVILSSLGTTIARQRSAIRRTLFEVADSRGNRDRFAIHASSRSDTAPSDA